MATFGEQLGPVLAPLRRFILRVALALASPFWALAILFLLLQKPLVWGLVCAAIGGLVLAMGYAAWLVVRSKLRDVAGAMDRAGGIIDVPRR